MTGAIVCWLVQWDWEVAVVDDGTEIRQHKRTTPISVCLWISPNNNVYRLLAYMSVVCRVDDGIV